ncbi:MAG: hypothetical protein FWG57_05600 [Endomicrobia bacterium]|nr:hypothetical protein [Endomicrobiia bacterium]
MKIEEKEFNKNIINIKQMLAASLNVPYYRSLYRKCNIDIANIKNYEDFKKIPITTKQDYRKNISDFINEDILAAGFNLEESLKKKFPRAYFKKHNIDLVMSSGSTGEPLTIAKHHRDSNNAFLLLNMHRKKKNDDILNMPYIWIWPVNPITRIESIGCKNDFEQINQYGNIYYLYKYNDMVFEKLFKFMLKEKVKWIIAAPSILSYFSDYIIKNAKKNILDIRYIECQSEYMFDWQSQIIKEAFNIIPTNIYATNEVQFIASTCSKGKMHVFTKNVFVELLETDKNVKEVVISTMCYKQMPLLRYKIGDCADWEENSCDCDNTTPVINLKQYRLNDLVVGKNNYYEHWITTDAMLALQLKNIFEFSQYQIIQEKVDEFQFKFRSSEIPNYVIMEEVKVFLKNYLERVLEYEIGIKINISKEQIPNDPISGKFKFFYCKIKDKIKEENVY